MVAPMVPLGSTLKLGISTIHRQGDSVEGPWLPRIDELCRFVEFIDRTPLHVWMAPAWQEIMMRVVQRSLAVMCPAC